MSSRHLHIAITNFCVNSTSGSSISPLDINALQDFYAKNNLRSSLLDITAFTKFTSLLVFKIFFATDCLT